MRHRGPARKSGKVKIKGIAIAKAEGKYTGRKRIEMDEVTFKKSCAEWRSGKRTAVSVQKEFGVSAQTFYRRVREYTL